MEKEKVEAGALRYDNNKIRLDLIPPILNEEIGKILTMGSNKYAPRNWELGMKWSRCIASLKRHLHSFEKGIDYDEESKELHLSHVIVNAMFLLQYYKTHPELDDRPHSYLTNKRIGLDIDDVLADWVPSFCKVTNKPIPTSWDFGFKEAVESLIAKGFDYPDFIRNLPVKTKPEDIPFEPTCYITQRNHLDISIAREWIAKNGFSQTEVIQTQDKVSAALERKLDIFVDDKYETFVAMNKAGIMCYLFDCPHNHRYNVGYKRIYSLKDLV